MDDDVVAAYLRRIGVAPPAVADAAALRVLHRAHQVAVPFENLSIHLPTCWWQQTSPASHFTRATICSRLTDDGRISVSDRTLIRTSGPSRTEQDLDTDDDLLAAYRDHFGIVLHHVPRAATAP